MKTLRTSLLALRLLLCAFIASGLQPVCSAAVPTTTAPAGLKTGKTVWVDGTNGNDSSGKRGRADKPYITVQAAINAAASGDTVQVRSGGYAETVTLANGVNLAFDTGAVMAYTSVSWISIRDNGASVTCVITGLKVTATGTASVRALEIQGASSSVVVDAVDLDTSASSASTSLIFQSNGTLRLGAKSIKSRGAAMAISGGTANIATLYIGGKNPYQVTGGTLNLDAVEMAVSATADSSACSQLGFSNTANVRFGKFTDTSLGTFAAFEVGTGTLNLQGGTIAKTTAGDAFNVTGGTRNIFSADVTGTFTGGDYAIERTGGTVNVYPGARFDGTKTSGTLNYMPVYGFTPTGAGLALLDDASASLQQTTLGVFKAYKTATTSRTNNTVAADPDLTIAVVASGVYKFRAWIPISGSTGGFQGGISLPTSPTNTRWTMKLLNYTGFSSTLLAYKSATDTTTTSGLTVANNYVLEIEGLLENGANAGSIAFHWAQQTTNASSTNVLSGAWLAVEKLN